jgi:hypothetical protein
LSQEGPAHSADSLICALDSDPPEHVDSEQLLHWRFDVDLTSLVSDELLLLVGVDEELFETLEARGGHVVDGQVLLVTEDFLEDFAQDLVGMQKHFVCFDFDLFSQEAIEDVVEDFTFRPFDQKLEQLGDVFKVDNWVDVSSPHRPGQLFKQSYHLFHKVEITFPPKRRCLLWLGEHLGFVSRRRLAF